RTVSIIQKPKHTSVGLDDVTIVIVAFNSARILGKCLASLPKGIKTILVDNASGDNTSAIGQAAGCKVITLVENMGYGTAANRGIDRADSKYVFLLNPDIVLLNDCIEILIEAAETMPRAAMLGPRQLNAEGVVANKSNDLEKNSYLDEPTEMQAGGDRRSVDFLVGSALFMKSALFANIGQFDENIFLFYEENDLCDRFIAADYQIILVNEALATHDIGSSTSNVNELEMKKRWHMAWSRQYYLRKNNKPSRASWIILVNFLKLSMTFITMNKKKRLRYQGNLGGTIGYLRGVKAQDRKMK
ncbi:MAG: glycosyltransferase family 2 protein, partial [Hyphomicrobiaceae bacterium]|nr:glycosyltransferase family 2 protein [Hyphomicrobiaceae bacterium]